MVLEPSIYFSELFLCTLVLGFSCSHNDFRCTNGSFKVKGNRTGIWYTFSDSIFLFNVFTCAVQSEEAELLKVINITTA